MNLINVVMSAPSFRSSPAALRWFCLVVFKVFVAIHALDFCHAVTLTGNSELMQVAVSPAKGFLYDAIQLG